jgi:hypothetical protein
MSGRSVLCLLALSLLVQAAFVAGQTDRPSPVSRFVRPLAEPARHPPIAIPSENPEFVPIIHGFPNNPAGPIGISHLVRTAGIIFSGTVTHIERRAARPGQSVETVAITFHVENAIRGATQGETLTISQWIGLWSGGQRYRLGQRVLLFLYPRSKLGLTSSVAGAIGRFDVDAWGRVLLSARHRSAFRVDPLLGGKSQVRFSDFALAVRQACEEE